MYFDTLVNTASRKTADSRFKYIMKIVRNAVLPTKVHGVTSQMTIFTQNINRDTVYGPGATKGKEEKRQKREL
jgi:hypothetical protein